MGVAIRRAQEADKDTVVRLLDEAFRDDPVSSWVFPDEQALLAKHPLLMAAFVDMALHEGYVDMTEDGVAAALWMSVPAGEHEDDDGPALMREAVDPGNERVELVGRLTTAAHPTDRPHEYLMLIAVKPERQGEGHGTALIEHVFGRCDSEGLHAYLEASSSRSRGLYERLGFAFMGRTVALPDGPHMWPMWREPSGAAARN